MNSTDIEALRALYVQNRQEFFTYALSITENREAAEDVIQAGFAKLLERGALPSGLRPYVFRAIRNAAYDMWRRTKVRTDSIFDAAAAMGATDHEPSAQSQMGELEPILQRLSPDERETIVLKIYGGLTFQEIADLREAPLPTVASWYSRGLEVMRTMLKAEFR